MDKLSSRLIVDPARENPGTNAGEIANTMAHLFAARLGKVNPPLSAEQTECLTTALSKLPAQDRLQLSILLNKLLQNL